MAVIFLVPDAIRGGPTHERAQSSCRMAFPDRNLGTVSGGTGLKGCLSARSGRVWTSAKKTTVRQAYDEWREALDLDDPDLPKIHRAWIDLILKQILELDENGDAETSEIGREVAGTRYGAIFPSMA